MGNDNNTIIIPASMVAAIREQALAEAPNECCGYLAGKDASAVLRLPLTNIDHSPEHFSLDPKEQFAAVKKARAEGYQLIAVYHSHPETPARMSDEDIRLAYDPAIVYVIYSLLDEAIKGFRVTAEKLVEQLEVVIA